MQCPKTEIILSIGISMTYKYFQYFKKKKEGPASANFGSIPGTKSAL